MSRVYKDKIESIDNKIKEEYFSIEYEKIMTTNNDCNHLFMEIHEKDYEMCAKCGSIQQIIRTEYYYSVS